VHACVSQQAVNSLVPELAQVLLLVQEQQFGSERPLAPPSDTVKTICKVRAPGAAPHVAFYPVVSLHRSACLCECAVRVAD
jgi:hypothetical protein